ncbi:MAG: translation initiation factor IF-2 [Spirochaetaceae bacterium]|jgi:translation initiation factor IF-2|nr:translation initiation factor IF-2 [Spirochaetaceae bacterium]
MAKEKKEEQKEKPKVELIKRKHETASESPAAPGPVEGEKRKVVIIKKKPVAVKPAAEAKPAVEEAVHKPAKPRVVISAKPVEEKPVVEAKHEEKPKDKKVPHAKPHTEEQEAKEAPKPREQSEKTNTKPERPTDIIKTHSTSGESRRASGQVLSYTGTARPAASAGRVGGHLVGAKPGPRHHRQGEGGERNRSGSGERTGFQRREGGYRGGERRSGQGGQGGQQGIIPRTQGLGQRTQGFRPGGQAGRPGQGGRPGGFGARPGFTRPGMAPPPPTDAGKQKKSFKTKKNVYQRKEEEMEEKLLQTKKKISHVANPVPKSIDIMDGVTVAELARKMNLKASDLITKLMSMGQMVTINQQIDADTAAILAAEYGAEVKIISLYDETVIENASDEGADMLPRPPVVTVMGHVDHGKTKLLDAIRSADVVSGEFGGITQHIGAYTVETPQGKITFLDTPGHEAFTRMRARGAQVTDIVVLVVAADDGVMPQTIEAINHARDAEVPIIVAVNKIDKPEANSDRVKTQLSELGLQPEEWGGETMFIEISALKKQGIDKLIDAILLEAEMLDLKANYHCRADGKILEARVDPGRGIVATVMVERGTLCVGDPFVAGVWAGRVRALFNDKGERVEEATPATPVEVLGFEGGPNAGEPFQVVEDDKYAREISGKRQELKRFEDAKNKRKITLDNLSDAISDGDIQELKVIIKADVQGSAEALRSSLEKLSTKEVRVRVIQALPGAINEGDVDLAIASGAIIIGFNVRPVPKAKLLADSEKVDVRRYNVIYKAVEEIQQAMEGMLKPDLKEETIGTVEVRQVFKVPKIGNIAGCYVLSGMVKRSASVHVMREDIEIHTGPISSLRRIKDDVREVQSGFECGIGLDGFDDIKEGDQFEVFEMVEVARKLSSNKGE